MAKTGQRYKKLVCIIASPVILRLVVVRQANPLRSCITNCFYTAAGNISAMVAASPVP